MSTSPHVVDVTAAAFATEVLAASRERPVLVDFWAPWCAPCRGLAPILEKLAAELDGRIRVAKVNTDEEGAIAQQFGIRGIPNVKAFVDGRVVDEFTGALPERTVREFIERLLPGPLEIARRDAREQLVAGRFAEAEAVLRTALAAAGADAPAERADAARIDLAELLIARQDNAGAEDVLAEVAEDCGDERLPTLRARVESWRHAASLPSAADLETRLAADAEDHAARLQLAERLIAEMRFEPALAALLAVVRGARGAERKALRESARQAMLRAFALAEEPALVGRYRRMLAAELN